jgi:nucleotide-binding universal stress UspA family protein
MMFDRVIAGVDGDPSGRDAIAVAKLLVDTAGRLSLVHVHELTPVRGASGAYGPDEDEESRRLLEREREETGANADLLTVTASSVGRGLHFLAEREHADLLCVGSSSRGFAGRVLIGDITRAALIGAPCAVAVAPFGCADAGTALAKVGVGYDGSPESEDALAVARELAARHGATLTALMVFTRTDAIEDGERELAMLEGVEGKVATGSAGEELATFSADVDLLVVGSRGYGPIRSLMLGSTAVHLASNAACPLLVLPRRST